MLWSHPEVATIESIATITVATDGPNARTEAKHEGVGDGDPSEQAWNLDCEGSGQQRKAARTIQSLQPSLK